MTEAYALCHCKNWPLQDPRLIRVYPTETQAQQALERHVRNNSMQKLFQVKIQDMIILKVSQK